MVFMIIILMSLKLKLQRKNNTSEQSLLEWISELQIGTWNAETWMLEFLIGI